jgi:hypothetical protein
MAEGVEEVAEVKIFETLIEFGTLSNQHCRKRGSHER